MQRWLFWSNCDFYVKNLNDALKAFEKCIADIAPYGNKNMLEATKELKSLLMFLSYY